jgi:hypothetical protein
MSVMTLAATAPALQPELAAVKHELLDARERARALAEATGAALFAVRPAAGRWSVSECLGHLNITSERMIPALDDAVRALRDQDLKAAGPMHRDVVGWLLCRFLEPPYRIRTRTPEPFVPRQGEPMAEVLERFDYLQGELLVRVDRAAGLALDRIKVASVFDPRVKYNALSAFAVIPVHQRRHLFQADRVRTDLLAHAATG